MMGSKLLCGFPRFLVLARSVQVFHRVRMLQVDGPLSSPDTVWNPEVATPSKLNAESQEAA